MEIYRGHLEIGLPLRRQNSALTSLSVAVTAQGCAEVGVCYPPIRRTLTLESATAPHAGTESPPGFVSEQDRIAESLDSRSVWFTVASFLGFGLLLAFTPCVFPMIPILSAIVAGHGARLTPWRAFGLSLSYVVASALTYMLFGVLAGLFVRNLQALFQAPWMIGTVSGLFVLLALSMFGVFSVRVPAALTAKLLGLGARQPDGRWLGAAAMGMV